MDVIYQKKQLRNEMLSKRNSALEMTKKRQYDKLICEALLNTIRVKNYKVVHAYLPMQNEINIIPLIEELLQSQITVVCPKTLKRPRLKNLVLSSLKKLEKGVFNTYHPSGDAEYTGEYDLIIVPGLAYDDQNFRLGYGGGYYDTFLEKQPKAHKIGIFYPFQQVTKVPIEKHDIPLDEILTFEIEEN